MPPFPPDIMARHFTHTYPQGEILRPTISLSWTRYWAPKESQYKQDLPFRSKTQPRGRGFMGVVMKKHPAEVKDEALRSNR